MAKILLIEDQAFTAKILETVMTSAGHTVTVVMDGEKGLEAFEADRPDVVITDIILPKMNGLAVISAIQAKAPRVPVIAMTGGSSTSQYSYLDKARELGALDVFRKPVAAEQLLSAIKRLVDLK
ncbi:MAG: response regulator [Proteobacteria bacterium]|nr:response regulator [Pseudomonadota bacterium]